MLFQQQHATRKPIRVRFPTVSIQHGGKKRRKRFDAHPYGYHRRENLTDEEEEEKNKKNQVDFSIFNLTD